MMQCGFALLECGSVRKKNASSILIKNLFDACVGYCGFWLVGYAFAFGDVK
jgi:Amt family ammonium transporter